MIDKRGRHLLCITVAAATIFAMPRRPLAQASAFAKSTDGIRLYYEMNGGMSFPRGVD